MKKRLLSFAFFFILSLTLLIGITYAWFSESITVSNNTIKTGKLDVMFVAADDLEFTENYVDLDDGIDAKIFNLQTLQPGDVVTRYVKVINTGTIDFVYHFTLSGHSSDETGYFNKHITYTISKVNTSSVDYVIEEEDFGLWSNYYELKPGHSDIYAITVKVNETMDNRGQGHSFVYGITIRAQQWDYVKSKYPHLEIIRDLD